MGGDARCAGDAHIGRLYKDLFLFPTSPLPPSFRPARFNSTQSLFSNLFCLSSRSFAFFAVKKDLPVFCFSLSPASLPLPSIFYRYLQSWQPSGRTRSSTA